MARLARRRRTTLSATLALLPIQALAAASEDKRRKHVTHPGLYLNHSWPFHPTKPFSLILLAGSFCMLLETPRTSLLSDLCSSIST